MLNSVIVFKQRLKWFTSTLPFFNTFTKISSHETLGTDSQVARGEGRYFSLSRVLVGLSFSFFPIPLLDSFNKELLERLCGNCELKNPILTASLILL
jgi:hypothetical protein